MSKQYCLEYHNGLCGLVQYGTIWHTVCIIFQNHTLCRAKILQNIDCYLDVKNYILITTIKVYKIYYSNTSPYSNAFSFLVVPFLAAFFMVVLARAFISS